jgi:hypothetical protein
MAFQVLNLILQATDRASRTIGNVVGKVTGLSAAMNRVQKEGGASADAIAWAMKRADWITNGFTTTVNKLENALSEAANIELENLSAATGLAGMMGNNIDKATQSVNRLNASMAKIAGPLPGSTADYVDTARQITPMTAEVFSDRAGNMTNVAGFEKMTQELSTSYTAMAAAGMVGGMSGRMAAQNMQLVLQRMLSGASQGDLRMLNAYGQNPILKAETEKYLKSKGVKELRELGSKEALIQAVNDIGKKVATPEYLEKATKTVNGMMENFISNLFDPNTGVFGLWKDLDNDVSNGVQSAFVSFEHFLTQIIGPDSIVSELGKLAEMMGIKSTTPMKMLSDAFEWMAGFTKNLVGVIKNFRESISKTTPESAFKWLQGALGGLGGWIAEQYNRFIYWLDRQVRDFDPSSIPSEQISGAIFGFIAGVADFFNKLDKGRTIQLGMRIIFKLIETIGYVLTNLDPAAYGVIAAVLLARTLPYLIAIKVSSMLGIMLGSSNLLGAAVLVGRFVAMRFAWLLAFAAGRMLGVVAAILGPRLYGAILFGVGRIAGAIAFNLLSAVGAVTAAFAGLPVIIIASLLTLVVVVGYWLNRVVTERRQELIDTWAADWDNISKTISGVWQIGIGIVTLNGPLMFEGMTKLFKSINSTFRDMQNQWSILTTGKTQDERDQIEADKRRADALTARGYSYVVDSDGNERLERNNWAAAKYRGHIPAAFGGLLSALSSESRNMPRGAGLAIANTSEAILRPEQLKNLVFGSVAAGAAGMGATFAPQIVINGGGDPQQTAELVMREMERMFGEFTRGQLA